MGLKTVTRATLGALLLILLAVVGIAHWQTRNATRVAEELVERYIPAQYDIDKVATLFHFLHETFHAYTSQDLIPAAEVGEPLDCLAEALGRLPDGTGIPTEAVEDTRHSAQKVRAAFSQYVAEVEDTPGTDTAAEMKKAVERELVVLRSELGGLTSKILGQTGASAPDSPLRVAANLLHAVETSFHAYAEQNRVRPTQLLDGVDQASGILKQLDRTISLENASDKAQRLIGLLQRYRAGVSSYTEEVRRGSVDATMETGKRILAELSDILDEAHQVLVEFRASLAAHVKRKQDAAVAIARRGQWAFLVLGGIGLILAAAVSGLFGRMISRRISPLVEGARRLAEGDFAHRVSLPGRGDLSEVAESFNAMAAALQEKTGQLHLSLSKLERAHEALAKANATLEQKVEARTVELRQALNTAEEASRSKSQFLANMSHEIRTPMNGVMGMLELLRSSRLEPRQQKFADIAGRSAETLLGILNDILDFSKIEAGKLELETIDFDLRETVEEVADLFAEEIHSKELEFVCQVAPEVPTAVRGDPSRLRQILSNLLGNAIKFTDRGEIVLRADATEDSEESVCVRFAVTDTGVGIPPAAQAHIFDSFAQADGSTTRKHGGTGLGLAISRQLVELMAGQIGVESESGKGSTFWFTAYFLKRPEPPAEARNVLEGLHGLSVLIVDDNETNREVLHHQLHAWGMADERASSGPEALGALRAAARRGKPYRLALLDLMMPEMDGLELAERVRSDAELASTHLILLTSVGLPSSPDEFRRAGIEACLSKPVRPSHLLDAITDVMSRHVGAGNRARPLPEAVSRDHSFQGARVLLAEDNRVNQEVALGILETLGIAVDLASNGREALEAFRQAAYDLVLMDCMMPEMDGYEATQAIRALEGAGKARTPIVAMTANAMAGDREACLDAGMDDYLSKPFSRDGLTEFIARWIPVRAEPTDRGSEPGDGERPGVSLPAATGTGPRKAEETPDRHRECLNPAALDSIRALERGGGTGILRRAMEGYLSQSPDLLAALREAVRRADAEAIRAAAHALKSSSATLGAEHMSALCKDLELRGRNGTVEGAVSLLASIESEFLRVEEALRAEIETQT